MTNIDKIDRLISKVEERDIIRIQEAIISFSDYISLVSKVNFRIHVNSLKDKLKLKTHDNSYQDQIDVKYEQCESELKYINKMCEKYEEEKIYEGDYSKADIEKFLLRITTDVFDSRSIKRK